MGKFIKAFDVYAKAAIKHSQIKTKLDIGCDGIELQMLDEIYRDGLHTWRDIEEVIDLGEFSNYPVRVVHAPLVPNRGDVLLERIADVDDFIVLDTCHQMLAEKYITGLYEMTGEFKAPDLSLRHYFEMYEDTIKLMHICGMKGSGYGKGKHGTPFKEADKDILQNIVDLKLQYAPACPATLEVEETDFAVCDGYSSTLNALQSCASFDVKEYLEEHFPSHWMDVPPSSLANLRTQEDCDKLIKELEG